jgi:hypothetical protein
MSGDASLVDVFRHLDMRHCLEVLDERSTTFRSTHVFEVRATMRTRFYFRKFMWSGVDHADTTELITEHDQWGHPRHRTHGPVIREGASRISIVDLGRTLEEGDTERIQMRHHLRDLSGTFTPFLSHRSRPHVAQVTLTVVLPISLAVAMTYRETMIDTDQDVDVRPVVGVPEDGRVRFERTIPAPAPTNRRYRLCWGRLA